MKHFFTLLFSLIFLFSGHLFAQSGKGALKLKVVDDKTQKPVDYATVSVIIVTDSSVVRSTATDEKGVAEIVGLKPGSYKVIVAQLGYANIVKPFDIGTDRKSVDLGTLPIQVQAKNLKEVEVKGERAPVVIKKDTTEFNAGSFKTQKNDDVEALLKKLPGVDVDKDGKITSQGKDVKKVLVDGKEFFGGDPKAATKNLPADAIDKVQMIDDKTDKAKNTGIDDGQRDKVINLKLKADKKSGYFGNISGVAGTDDRYLGDINVNHFDSKRQMSLIFLSNNINESGFTYEDLNNFSGGNIFNTFASNGGGISMNISSNGRVNINNAFSGVSGGLMKNTQGGLNYSDEFGKKGQLKFNANFVTVISSNVLVQNTNLQDIPNSLLTNQASNGNNHNNSYRLNLSFDWKLDTLTTLKFKPSISTTDKSTYSDLHSTTTTAALDSVNRINQLFNNSTTSPAYGGQLSFNRRFTEGKGSVNFFTYGNYSADNSNYINISGTKYYVSSATNGDINQQASADNNSSFINSTASYIRQLSKKHKIDLTLSQSLDYTKQNNDQYTVDYNAVTGKYEILDPLLSGNFDNRNWRYTTTAGLAKSTETTNINLNMAAADLGLRGDFTNNGSSARVHRDEFALTPNASFSYRPKKGFSYYINVGTDVSLPSATDLQPVFNNTNPLYIRIGNPDLKMSRSLRISGNISHFDFKNNTYINVYGNFSNTWNGFSTASTVDSAGITTSQPINTNGNYNANFGFNVGQPTHIKGLRYSLGLNGSINRNVNYIDGNENAVRRLSPGLSTNITYDNDNTSFGFRTYTTYNNAANSYQHLADQHYYQYNNNLTASQKFLKTWRIFSDVNQNLYRGEPASANTSFYIWNAGIEHYFLKSQNLTLSLNAYDMLNQSAGIQRSISNTGVIQNIQSNTLGRYGYVKLIYKLSKVGNAGQKAGDSPKLIIMR